LPYILAILKQVHNVDIIIQTSHYMKMVYTVSKINTNTMNLLIQLQLALCRCLYLETRLIRPHIHLIRIYVLIHFFSHI